MKRPEPHMAETKTKRKPLKSRSARVVPKYAKRDSHGMFKPEKKTPKKETGRNGALKALDMMLSKPSNRKRLDTALQDYFRDEPIAFYKSIVMPLFPKEALLRVQTSASVVVLTHPTAPPANWYQNVRSLIGHHDGDIALPHEIVDVENVRVNGNGNGAVHVNGNGSL